MSLVLLIAFGMALLLLFVLLLVALLLIIRRPGSPQDQQQDNEETRMIQAMQAQLGKMEERVEALETILSDHGKEPQGR